MFLAMQNVYLICFYFFDKLVVYCTMVYKSDTDSIALILRKTLNVLFADFVCMVPAFYFIIYFKLHSMHHPKVLKTTKYVVLTIVKYVFKKTFS